VVVLGDAVGFTKEEEVPLPNNFKGFENFDLKVKAIIWP
jgi:hypothetical protein